MKRMISTLVVLAFCSQAHAACTEDRRAELGDAVSEMENVAGRMESYVVEAEKMHSKNDEPSTILPVLERFMTTLESEFNDNKNVYNSLDMQYDCSELESRVHAIYERMTNASVGYAELKFKLQNALKNKN